VQKIAGDRVATFIFKSLLRSKLNPRLTFSLGSCETGTLQPVRAKFNMRSELLFQFAFGLPPMHKPRRQRPEIRDHNCFEIRNSRFGIAFMFPAVARRGRRQWPRPDGSIPRFPRGDACAPST